MRLSYPQTPLHSDQVRLLSREEIFAYVQNPVGCGCLYSWYQIADDFESDGEKAVAKKKPQTSTEGVIMLVNEEGSVVLNDTTNEKVKHENGDAWVVLSRSRYEYTLEKLVYNLRKLCLAKERTLCLNW